jgi:hypothetical protein
VARILGVARYVPVELDAPVELQYCRRRAADVVQPSALLVAKAFP